MWGNLNWKSIIFSCKYFDRNNLQSSQQLQWWYIHVLSRITHRSTSQNRNKSKYHLRVYRGRQCNKPLGNSIGNRIHGFDSIHKFCCTDFTYTTASSFSTCPITPNSSPAASLSPRSSSWLSHEVTRSCLTQVVNFEKEMHTQVISSCGFILCRQSPETSAQEQVTNFWCSHQVIAW